MLRECGVRDIRINYLCADTLRVPRDTLAEIIIAWRDGFSEPIGRHSRFSEAEARERMDDIIDTINNPDGYFVWLVPVITAINPE
ncbi:MAG: SAM-dependent methyltransferase, partial [Gammaproteobacteria bacterium]